MQCLVVLTNLVPDKDFLNTNSQKIMAHFAGVFGCAHVDYFTEIWTTSCNIWLIDQNCIWLADWPVDMLQQIFSDVRMCFTCGSPMT